MKRIRVVCAAIVRNGKLFAAQRGYGEYKNWWEFPGGKVEDGESETETVIRELSEELGIAVEPVERIGTAEKDYPEFHLSLTCYVCRPVAGEPELREHEAARWVSKEEMYSLHWLPADLELLPGVEKYL